MDNPSRLVAQATAEVMDWLVEAGGDGFQDVPKSQLPDVQARLQGIMDRFGLAAVKFGAEACIEVLSQRKSQHETCQLLQRLTLATPGPTK